MKEHYLRRVWLAVEAMRDVTQCCSITAHKDTKTTGYHLYVQLLFSYLQDRKPRPAQRSTA